MDIRDMECIVILAEELHFSRAAERLRIAQPPLSKRIQKVERELGFTLFDRSKHKVELTAAGKEIVHHVRQVLAAADGVKSVSGGLRHGTLGLVRIASVGSSFYEALPRLLTIVKEQLPRLELHVTELETPALVEALKFGEIDIGFVRPPASSGLITKEVWTESLVVAVGPTFPLRGRTRLTVADIIDEDIVFFDRAEGPGYWDSVAAFFQAEGVAFEPKVRSPHVTTMISLVALGAGVTLVPESARRLHIEGVKYLPVEPEMKLPLAAAFLPNVVNKALQRVIESLPVTPLSPNWNG